MPFVTEETWQQLRAFGMPSQYDALMVADWPLSNKMFFDARAEKDFTVVMEIVRAIRNARTEFNVEPGKRIPAIISAGARRETVTVPLLESQRAIIASLARLDPDAFRIEKRAAKPAQSLALVVGKLEIYLPLAGMIEIEKEKARLAKEIAQARGEIERVEKLLGGEFAKKAPKEVVQKQRDALAANRERAVRLDAQLASLEDRTRNSRKERKPRKDKSPA
jgi:valyl-tRNA synthetase